MASKARGGRDLSDDSSSPRHVNFPPDAGLAKIIPRSPEGSEEYVLYQALYKYTSSDPDDLSFEANDILQVTDEGDGSPQTWMYGRRQTGEEGHFPSTYVRKINVQAKRTVSIDMLDEDEPSPTATTPAAPKAADVLLKLSQSSATPAASASTKAASASSSAGKSAAATKAAAPTKAAPVTAVRPERPFALYQALYDYNSGDDGDLVFQANDILRVFDEGDGPNSWMEGETQDGRSGTFPGTYVRKMNTSRKTVAIKGLEHTQ